jgi:A/G-specific adenine glycosylase
VVHDLLQWWRENGRRFEWRDWTDPYRLLVVEILLRQTRAETVAGFIVDFFEKYPTASSLASAPHSRLAEALRHLGLGEQRAAQLRLMAVAVRDTPIELRAEALLALPGIGRYSAGMVAAVAGEPDAVAVDTNIARLISRLRGLEPSHSESRKSTNLWEAAAELTSSSDKPIEVLWAALDLAAIHCVARAPRCSGCPLEDVCVYRRAHRA